MYSGEVLRVNVAKGFGFVSIVGDTADAFFHKSDLSPEIDFDEQLCGRRVKFYITENDKGLKAIRVTARL